MKVGDVVTWRTATEAPPATHNELGIIVGKHSSYKGKFWWVCFMTGCYAHRDRVLCNQEHLIKLENI